MHKSVNRYRKSADVVEVLTKRPNELALLIAYRFLALATRARFGLFAVWTLYWAHRFYASGPLRGDWWVFQSGARIFSGIGGSYWAHYPGGPLHLYESTPKFQTGPPAFLLSIPSLYMSFGVGREVMAILLASAGLVVIFLAERLAVRIGRAVETVRKTSLIAGMLLVPIWCTLGVAFMHLDDVMVLILLEVALLSALRERSTWMGILLGCAIATKPWAVSFLPLVAMLPRQRVRRAWVTAVFMAILWWLPFLVAAPMTAAEMSNIGMPAQPMSLWGLIGFHIEPTGGREIQLALAVAACAVVVARRCWWAAPVVATALRIGLDWQAWSYYGAALVACALLFDLCERRSQAWPWVTSCALLAALVVPVAESTSIPAPVAAVVRLALLFATAFVAYRHAPRRTQKSADPALETRQLAVMLSAPGAA